jgi:hypothetical protein
MGDDREKTLSLGNPRLIVLHTFQLEPFMESFEKYPHFVIPA